MRKLMNAWISPRGDIEQVGYFGHANFAIDMQKGDDMLDGHQAVQELHDFGWGRVVDWDIGKIPIYATLKWKMVAQADRSGDAACRTNKY